jgi:hypothetical protein
MGLYEDFGEALPQDRRDAFKTAVSALDGAVKIDSREILDKLAEKPGIVQSWKDALISKATASHEANFRKDTLPGLIEEEIKKRGPKPKDPELAAALDRVEALEKAKKQAEDENKRITQLSKVLPVITELGLDAKWADRLIGNTDAETEETINAFKADVTKVRDGYTEKVLKERFGNQGMPPRGDDGKPVDLKTAYQTALAAGKADEALMLQEKIMAQARSGK